MVSYVPHICRHTDAHSRMYTGTKIFSLPRSARATVARGEERTGSAVGVAASYARKSEVRASDDGQVTIQPDEREKRSLGPRFDAKKERKSK